MIFVIIRGCRGRDHMVVECSTICAILRQVGGFLRVLQLPPLMKLTSTI